MQFCIFILLLVVFSLRLPNAKPRQFALWLSSSFAVILSWCSFKLAGCARCRNGRGGGTPAHVLPQAVVQGVRHAEARPGSGALVGGERGQRGGPVAGQLQRWRAGNAFRAKLFSRDPTIPPPPEGSLFRGAQIQPTCPPFQKPTHARPQGGGVDSHQPTQSPLHSSPLYQKPLKIFPARTLYGQNSKPLGEDSPKCEMNLDPTHPMVPATPANNFFAGGHFKDNTTAFQDEIGCSNKIYGCLA